MAAILADTHYSWLVIPNLALQFDATISIGGNASI